MTAQINFLDAMSIVERGFDMWKDKPHNAKWFNRIDGTPIPNDLKVNIAEAICGACLNLADQPELGNIYCTLNYARIFIASHEKMHPDGVALYDELIAKIE